MNKQNLEQRMYCLVLRHLSPINKGVQCTHACEQYGEFFRNEADYRKYIEEDKTLIMLEGGSSIDMYIIEEKLIQKGVQFYAFKEPDLMNLTTAICFLADERIWNFEQYPDIKSTFEIITNSVESNEKIENSFIDYINSFIDYIGGVHNYTKLQIIFGKRLAT